MAYQTGFAAATPNLVTTQPGAIYPNVPTTANTAVPSAQIGWDPSISKTPYMIQYNFNIQREIAAGTVLTVGYVGSHGVHLLTGVEKNPPTPTVVNGVDYFTNAAGVQNPRVNPALGTFTTPEPITTSEYNSLQAVVNRRFTRNVQAQLCLYVVQVS